MRRAGWIVPALLLAAGCMDFEPVAGPGPEGPSVFLFLESRNPGPGTAPDTLRVSGAVNQAGRVPFADDTLRVAGRAIGPQDQPHWLGYSDTLLLQGGTLAQAVPVRLPVPSGAPLPLQEFSYHSVARAGPDTLSIRAGADLVLPVRTGGEGLPQPSSELWNVSLMRGYTGSDIRATSPLPGSITIPASLVPADTASVVRVELRSQRSYRAEGSGTVSLSAEAVLHWRVRIIP